MELERRADVIRQRDTRRREATKKKEEKEVKEKEARMQQGIGLATQLAGFSGTQMRMKRGMEAFVRYGRAKGLEELKITELAEEDWEEESPKRMDSVDIYTFAKHEMGDQETTCTIGVDDNWEDLLASGTQLARELNSPIKLKLPPVPKFEAKISTKGRNSEPIPSKTQSTTPRAAESPLAGDRRTPKVSTLAAPKTPNSGAGKSRFEQVGLSTPELYEAFAEDGFAFEELSHQNQSTMPPPPIPLTLKPPLKDPPSIPQTTNFNLHDLGLSTQILNDAFDDPPDVVLQKSNSSSSFGLDGALESSWEAALFSKLAEVEA